MQFLLASVSLGRYHYRYFTKSKMRPQKGKKRLQTFSCEDSNWTQTLNLTFSPTLWCLPFYSWKVKVLVTQSYLTLWNPMAYSPPRSSVHEILQARILERVAIPFSRGSSWPWDWTQVSCIAGRCFTFWTTSVFLFLLLFQRHSQT